MRKVLLLLLLMVTTSVSSQTLEGPYSGVLDVMGQMKLTITLHFKGNQCTMDVKEQSAKNLPLEIKKITKDSVIVTSSMMNMTYQGAVKGEEIKGTFMQNGLSLPLSFKKGESKEARPQEPTLPLPYQTEEVTFTNPADGAVLSGTLTYPLGWENSGKKCPVVLMVSGSGLQDRDEQLLGHRPFYVLADRLAKSGIATLRYDDRGVENPREMSRRQLQKLSHKTPRLE